MALALALALALAPAPASGQANTTSIPSAEQRGGSLSEKAGGMKVNKKALDGFGDPPPPKAKPVLSGKASKKPAPQKASPAPGAKPKPKPKKKPPAG